MNGRARRHRIALLVLLAAAGGAAPAQAAGATYCVEVEREGCIQQGAAAAFAEAGDLDRILIGAVTIDLALESDAAVVVIGSGEGVTVLTGGLTLSSPAAQVSAATIGGLDLAGTATGVHVDAVAALHGSAVLQAARVTGAAGVEAVDGAPRLDTVVLQLTGGPGIAVACDASVHARHVTLAGTPAAAVTTACALSGADVRDSILRPEGGEVFSGPGDVATDHTNLPGVAGRTDGPGDSHGDPGFVPGTLRPAPGSALIDAGRPGALAETEWHADRDGLPRVSDGDGDGILVRDPGAYELGPRAVPVPAGNLLQDPGAEAGGGWELAGGFTRVRYGVFPFPSAPLGAALGAGGAFFAGGPALSSSARQRVDLSGLAPEIDGGSATAAVSGLLGGYRLDADAGTFEVAFLGPAGQPLGTLALATPTAAERANATTLLPRAGGRPIPPLTRAAEVTLRAQAAVKYDDAYFDNLALTATAPGAPPPPGPGGPPLKPFAGLGVLRGVAIVDRRGRVPVWLGCPDATVGRCTGVITLTARLRRGAEVLAVGRKDVALAAGADRIVRVRLTRGARRAVRERRRMRMTLFASVRDGQGVARLRTVPMKVKWRRR